jgi:hypothetical protein
MICPDGGVRELFTRYIEVILCGKFVCFCSGLVHMMSKPREVTPRQPAAEMIQACVSASLDALRQALRIPEKLENRVQGEESTNPFRERPILAIVECEAAVIGTFSSYKLPVRLVSREHGTKNLHESPQLLLVLNGLDGSASFVGKGPSGSHGTLLSVFSSLEPSYRDYVCAGMADFKSGRLYLAVRGQGLEMYDGASSSNIHYHLGLSPPVERGMRVYLMRRGLRVYGSRLCAGASQFLLWAGFDETHVRRQVSWDRGKYRQNP